MKALSITIFLFVFVAFSYSEDFTRNNLLNPKAINAVERGLNYLANNQDPETGAWLNDVGFKLNTSFRIDKENKPHVGITSLACMALMSSGNLPNRGRYGKNVRAGLDYVLSCVKDTGYITKHGTRMYSHAFATLFLAQVYGMTQDETVKRKLQTSINLISKCQNSQGGWRYEPMALDADMSVTVCQLQALRSARNVGLKVSKRTIDRAIAYIRRSSDNFTGGFKYQDLLGRPSRVSFAITAAGITALHGAGVYNGYLLQKSLNYLKNPPIYSPHPSSNHYFFYYGHYYAAQAMFVSGEPYWSNWYKKIRDKLVRIQTDDGSWEDNTGNNCPTAIATIILQLPNRYLPIFQK